LPPRPPPFLALRRQCFGAERAVRQPLAGRHAQAGGTLVVPPRNFGRQPPQTRKPRANSTLSPRLRGGTAAAHSGQQRHHHQAARNGSYSSPRVMKPAVLPTDRPAVATLWTCQAACGRRLCFRRRLATATQRQLQRGMWLWGGTVCGMLKKSM
jgi:hypothetical protein